MPKKILFIDRDGTIIKETPPHYRIDTFEELSFYPDVFYYLRLIAQMDFELVMVTNQDGLGEPDFPYEEFNSVHDFIIKTFEEQGIHFSKVFIDVTYPHENKATRKPGTAMLKEYIDNPAYDLQNSFVIGDRITDMQLAKNLGCKGFWLNVDESLGADETSSTAVNLNDTIVVASSNWKDIYAYLQNLTR